MWGRYATIRGKVADLRFPGWPRILREDMCSGAVDAAVTGRSPTTITTTTTITAVGSRESVVTQCAFSWVCAFWPRHARMHAIALGDKCLRELSSTPPMGLLDHCGDGGGGGVTVFMRRSQLWGSV